LASAGARNLVFGLESGSDEILRSMNKGGSVARARDVIVACENAGIGVNLQCFLGFPGETRAQSVQTLSFVHAMKGVYTTVSCGIFELQKGSPVWQRPSAYGVTIVPPEEAEDLLVRFEYTPFPDANYRRQLVCQAEKCAAARAPQVHCGISAHALAYIASGATCVGVPVRQDASYSELLAIASDASCRSFKWEPSALHSGTRLRKRTCYLAYSQPFQGDRVM
jgi:hypothetical protein